ncbi:MAG: hypothetical protein PHR41_03195 [Lactococcus chungangensis]|uniref:SipW-cognate class signal peptide n=1 Tax=Pseudolactococcus chungangensis CAU 28 = DSM 22330 TaxID=1122154 RepID=A0A1K2HAC2_9LACT|nr:hypothetical protein [Lactococcus chungangensis]MDD3015485.1 hypothetical protein [Lactococcus chungangensis]PCS04742.1 hypothetical protein RR45_GL000061 [Lactococcus chungangensis CAU 28 = DSM 22330]SFZ73728.1 hypothetical protein SAMN02746068_00920 [Lactococcus chungangensis CAU 28 = DSM 22330]
MKLNGKIVSALALVTLGAAIGGAGTLAKYTSQVEVGSSEARLAKYQFNQTGTLDLFAASYDGTVQAKNGTDLLIAPGTTAKADIAFESNSEVKTETVVNLTKVETTGVLLDHIKVNVSIAGAAPAAATLRTIKDALADDKEVTLGNPVTTNAATAATITVPVTWTYDFEGTGSYDADDTAAASAATMPTVKLTFTGINTQID